ncbi:MAG: Imm72 protein, partial [Pseudomonadota bacterium]|nr:Imm72 protein [Pseudomonadota bacterium]
KARGPSTSQRLESPTKATSPGAQPSASHTLQMVYMCQGEEAFRYGEPCWHSGGGQAITWKLIWEDQRYLDGVIPPEEAEYFPDGAVTPPDFSGFVGEDLVLD